MKLSILLPLGTVYSKKSYFCDDGWQIYNGRGEPKCFKYFEEALLKPDARDVCYANDARILYINSRHENDFFTEKAKEENWYTFWLGINDGKIEGRWVIDKSGDRHSDLKLAEYFHWNHGEPNNWGGHEENSVEFFGSNTGSKVGYWNDIHRWEKKNFVCQKPANRYKIIHQEGVTWQEAQEGCQSIGADLVTFDTEDEFEKVKKMVSEISDSDAYWIGYRDDDEILKTSNGKLAKDWVHSYFLEGEPNNKMGEENCIRMRWKAAAEEEKDQFTMNDAPCTLYWAGPKRANVGMSYICEVTRIDQRTLDRRLEDAKEHEEPPPQIMYINSFIQNFVKGSFTDSFERRRGTFGIFKFVKWVSRSNGSRSPVYESVEEPGTYFYYSHDDQRWDLKDGFWKFNRVVSDSPEEALNIIENDNSISGSAYIDASRPNPIQISSHRRCRQNSKIESDFVEFNCLRNPEYNIIKSDKNSENEIDLVIGIDDEFQGNTKNNIRMELRLLLSGPYREETAYRPFWLPDNQKLYKKENFGVYFTIKEDRPNMFVVKYTYTFYTAKGIAKNVSVYQTHFARRFTHQVLDAEILTYYLQ